MTENTVLIGLFITREERRGRGIGQWLLAQIREKFPHDNFLLYSVVDARNFYIRFGFKFSDFTIANVHLHQPRPKGSFRMEEGLEVVQIKRSEDMNLLKNYDKNLTKLERFDNLSKWLMSDHCKCYAAIKDGQCVGYGGFRSYPKFHKAQPLYADSASVAMALIQTYLSVSSCQLLRFRPHNLAENPTKAEVFQQFGQVEVLYDTEYRMFTLYDIPHQNGRIFSIANSETTFV